MFSPWVFVCLFVCLYLSDVCPDDLIMKDWCHRNNILQVHSLRCLVLQFIFHTPMMSLMTSQSRSNFEIDISQYFRLIVDQKLKISEMFMAILLAYSTFGITSLWTFWKCWNIKHSFNLTYDMKRSSQIMPEKIFFTGRSPNRPSMSHYEGNKNIFHD